MLHYLIYTSRSHHHWSEEDLMRLLDTSWTNNRKRNLSGILVYLGDQFIQLLEGKEEDVVGTFSKIRSDGRHKNIQLLLEGRQKTRIFKSWSMGFKSLDFSEFEELTGLTDPKSLFLDENINNQSHPALIFLKLFYDKNYRDFSEHYVI